MRMSCWQLISEMSGLDRRVANQSVVLALLPSTRMGPPPAGSRLRSAAYGTDGFARLESPGAQVRMEA